MNRVSRRTLARYATNQLLARVSIRKLASELVGVLVADKRVAETQQLLADIDYELESRGKLAVGEVTTASGLSSQLRSEVSRLIKNSAKVAEVVIEEIIDKNVVGGVRIKTATRVWDKTVTHQLDELREVF